MLCPRLGMLDPEAGDQMLLQNVVNYVPIDVA